MKNLQVIEKKDPKHDGLELDIVKVWYTIQGEGPFAGKPAIFIRLAGCNLQCPGCDTDYTTDRRQVEVNKLYSEAIALLPKETNRTNLIVVTGGEPFRQNVIPMLDIFTKRGFHVQFETNGTIPEWGLSEFTKSSFSVVCSPKAGVIHPKLHKFITAMKYVGEAGQLDEEDGLPLSVLGNKTKPARPPAGIDKVYLQPMDSGTEKKNDANLKAVVESCMKHGYILCLQQHKIIGLE